MFESDSTSAQEIPLHERVDTLFRTWHAPGAAPESNAGVAKALRQGGTKVSERDISSLRTSPSRQVDPGVLTALAQYFHTDPAYLLSENHHAIHTQLLFLEQMIASEVRNISLRGEQTSEDRRDIAQALARRLRLSHD